MPGGRPYFKYFIGGGVVCVEGGPFLAIGLELAFFSNMVPGSNMLRTMAIVLSLIGAVSLCVGLPLLYKGVNERNLWLRHQRRDSPSGSTFLYTEEPLEKPMMRTTLSGNSQRRFCAACGTALPNLSNIKFCPKCGEVVI